jgi:hypothetical protein
MICNIGPAQFSMVEMNRDAADDGVWSAIFNALADLQDGNEDQEPIR